MLPIRLLLLLRWGSQEELVGAELREVRATVLGEEGPRLTELLARSVGQAILCLTNFIAIIIRLDFSHHNCFYIALVLCRLSEW